MMTKIPTSSIIRPLWRSWVSFDLPFGILLIILFGAIRFVIVLNGIKTGDSTFVSIIFLTMIVLPFILLTNEGRREIGIKSSFSLTWMVVALLLGGFASLLIFKLGLILYSTTYSNWFVYIGKSYPVDLVALSAQDKQIYFFVFCAIGSFFSPFGEELLYRGVIHASLTNKLGTTKASITDSFAFGITHLAHFGILYLSGSWFFYPVPAFLWVIIIFFTGLLFSWCKTKTGAIWGAIACHIGFNLVMTYCIFYQLS